MKEERILEALGAVRDEYVQQAAPVSKGQKGARPWIAAAVVFLLGVAAFLQTAPGIAAATFVKEQVVNWFETAFSPKEITTQPEGLSETGAYEAGGQEPQGQAEDTPGFVLYYDTERYAMSEEEGKTYLRPILDLPSWEELRTNYAAELEGLTAEEEERKIEELFAQEKAFYDSLPKCELEICHISDISPEEAAKQVREEKRKSWERVSEVEDYPPLKGVMFQVSEGTAWDSPVERLYFVDDKEKGTYQLTLRYYIEAAEGHGVRLTTTLNTFEVLSAGE